MGKAAIGYARTSTKKQCYDFQVREIERWCEESGIELKQVFVDHGVSGGKPIEKSPALLDAINASESEDIGYFVYQYRDRVARCVKRAALVDERLNASSTEQINLSMRYPEFMEATEIFVAQMKDAFRDYFRSTGEME